MASSIISITPHNAHSQLVRHIEEILTDKESTNNIIYSSYLVFNKLLKVIDSENVLHQILSLVSSECIMNFKVDYMTHSLWIDLLVKLVNILHGGKQQEAIDLLFGHVRVPLHAFTTHQRLCIIGQPYLEKSLAHGVVQLLKHSKGLRQTFFSLSLIIFTPADFSSFLPFCLQAKKDSDVRRLKELTVKEFLTGFHHYNPDDSFKCSIVSNLL